MIKKNAFTMIELLVVISIIGILVALSMVSFTASQKQARDSQRKSDLRQYSTALEAFASKGNGLYPARTASGGQPASTVLCPDLGLSGCPEDPKYANDSSYQYRYSSGGGTGAGATATKYVLWAKLENVSNTFWVVCSTGQSGKISSTTTISGGECPSGLTQ